MSQRKDQPVEKSSEHLPLELQEYVSAYRESSSRVRVSLYILIVATLLVLVAQHNLSPGSWPTKRMEAWFRGHEVNSQHPNVPGWMKNAPVTDLNKIEGEYIEEFTSRTNFTASPIPGLWIDPNDLGIFGGSLLVILVVYFLFCFSREYENLYLGLFKVRKLADDEGICGPDSKANLLYHALAMCQVLGPPPTLALWRRKFGCLSIWLPFFVPALVHSWITYDTWKSKDVAEFYGRSGLGVALICTAVSLLLFVLGLVACVLSRAISRRWERAFFRINPQLEEAPPMSFRDWLAFPKSNRHQRKFQFQAVHKLEVEDLEPERQRVDVKAKIDIKASIRINDRLKISERFERNAVREARERCEQLGGRFLSVESLNCNSSVLDRTATPSQWRVEGACEFSYWPKDAQTDVST